MATLDQVVDELCDLYERRAFHEAARVRAEVTTVHQQVEHGASIAAAQRLADFYSLEDRVAVIDLDARIAGLLLRKEQHERRV